MATFRGLIGGFMVFIAALTAFVGVATASLEWLAVAVCLAVAGHYIGNLKELLR